MNTLSSDKKLEIMSFLKNHSIFQVLDREIIEGLAPQITEVEYGPGSIVFQEGDPADAIYIIRRGAVAVIQSKPQPKVLAYLTAGECFGEMAIIHDAPRNATIRVPEEASILRLPSAALKDLTRLYPAITNELADIINRRTTGDSPFKPPGLQGNLAFFDLPTVIQAVLGSRRSGVLVLYGRSGKAVGQLVMKDAVIGQAIYDQLKGEFALYELMNSDEPLDFTFDQKDISGVQPDPDLFRRPPYMLMIEGARRADELPKLMKNVGWPDATYEQIKRVPDFKILAAELPRELCRQIWLLIEVGSAIEVIWRQLAYDKYAVLTVVNEMINAGFLRVEVNLRCSSEFVKRTMQFRKPSLDQLSLEAAMAPERETPAGVMVSESPYEVVKLVNAVNSVSTNLGIIFGKTEMRILLQESLAKTTKLFPELGSLRVYMDSPALDLRGATSDFSSSARTIPALVQLANTLLELTPKLLKSGR